MVDNKRLKKIIIIIFTLIISRYIPNGPRIILYLFSLGIKSLWIIIIGVLCIENMKLSYKLRKFKNDKSDETEKYKIILEKQV